MNSFETNYLESTTINILHFGHTLCIINVYITRVVTINDISNLILSLFTSLPTNCKIIIIGDFNIGMLHSSKKQRMLVELMQQYNFFLIADSTTTFAGTLLDHFWIHNINDQFTKFLILDTYWSDHLAISLQL